MGTESETSETTAAKIPLREIEMREFRREDLPQLPDLLRDCLGRHTTEAWLDWKFFHNPYDAPLRFCVALHQGRLMGFIGANPVPFSCDGEMTPVYQHQDVAIREECRGFRLLRQMINACEEGTAPANVKFSYSLTPPHMVPITIKWLKYKVVWESLKLAKLTSLRAYVSKATRSAKLTAMMPGPIGRSWRAPGSSGGDIVEVDRFGPDVDDFWNKANAPSDEVGRIFAWQDAAWLNHKFCEDEIVPFRRFVYREGGEVIGYVVTNVTRLDVRIGFIDAMWSLPGRADVIELLTDFATHELLREKCDQLACWTRPDVPLGRALAGRGFVRRPTNMCLSIKQMSPGMGDLGLEYEHWNLQRGHTYYTSIGHLGADEGKRLLYKAREAEVERRRA